MVAVMPLTNSHLIRLYRWVVSKFKRTDKQEDQ